MSLLDIFKKKKLEESAQSLGKVALGAVGNIVAPAVTTVNETLVKPAVTQAKEVVTQKLDENYSQKYGEAYKGLDPIKVGQAEAMIITKVKDENEYESAMADMLKQGQYWKARKQQKDTLNKTLAELEVQSIKEADPYARSNYNMAIKQGRVVGYVRDLLDNNGYEHMNMDDESVFNTFFNENPDAQQLVIDYIEDKSDYRSFIQNMNKLANPEPEQPEPSPTPQPAQNEWSQEKIDELMTMDIPEGKPKNWWQNAWDFIWGLWTGFSRVGGEIWSFATKAVGEWVKQAGNVGQAVDTVANNTLGNAVGLFNKEAGDRIKQSGQELSQASKAQTDKIGEGIKSFGEQVAETATQGTAEARTAFGIDNNSWFTKAGDTTADIAASLLPLPWGAGKAAVDLIARFGSKATKLPFIQKLATSNPKVAEYVGQLGRAGVQGAIDAQKFNIVSEGELATAQESALGAVGWAAGKVVGDVGAKILDKTKVATLLSWLMTPSKIKNIKNQLIQDGVQEWAVKMKTAKDVADWMFNRKISGSPEEMAKQLKSYAGDELKRKDAILNKISIDNKWRPVYYTVKKSDDIMNKLYKEVEWRDILGDKTADFVNRFAKDVREDGTIVFKEKYTPKELEDIKRSIDDNISIYKESGDVKDRKLAEWWDDVRKLIRRQLEDIATKKWVPDLRKINNNISTAQALSKAITDKGDSNAIADAILKIGVPWAIWGAASLNGNGVTVFDNKTNEGKFGNTIANTLLFWLWWRGISSPWVTTKVWTLLNKISKQAPTLTQIYQKWWAIGLSQAELEKAQQEAIDVYSQLTPEEIALIEQIQKQQ